MICMYVYIHHVDGKKRQDVREYNLVRVET